MTAGPSRDLHALADRLELLRPDWRDPARYFEARDELAAELRLMGVPRAPTAWSPPRRPAPAPPDERVRRLAALSAARERENIELRRLLASARPPPRTRPARDARQLALPLPAPVGGTTLAIAPTPGGAPTARARPR